MTTDLQDAMWKNKPDRIAKAKEEALVALKVGNTASFHSIMLSAYITALGGKPVERHPPVKFFLLALWHALCMSRQLRELNHNQLDVWLQFMLKLRSKLGPFKGIINGMLTEGAPRAIARAEADGKPHQRALASMTYAEVTHAVNADQRLVEVSIKFALNREEEIRAEPDQPQGLRQFVRVLRKAGELYGKLGDKEKQRQYLNQAYELARGEADASDQVYKIYLLLAKL